MTKKKGSADFPKMNICATGAAVGIAWGVGVFLLALFSMWFDLGTPIVMLCKSLYVGYAASYLGAFIGLFWGIIDGFIFGIIFGWIYNKFCCHHSCFVCCQKK